MPTNKYVRIAELLHRERKLRDQADKLLAEAKKLLGSGNGLCYGHGDGLNGRTSYYLEIPLTEYLALFPEAQPRLVTFERQSGTRAYMAYPDTYVEDGKEVSAYVSARTPAADLTITDKEITNGNER